MLLYKIEIINWERKDNLIRLINVSTIRKEVTYGFPFGTKGE
jgi:hypothetical protein